MAGTERRTKNQSMAADLLKRGYYHGRRMGKGLSNIPPLTDTGSAAYRRRTVKVGR